jgi:MAST domain-containing protein
MKTKLIIIGILCMILLTGTVAASSPYVKIDVYYNERLLPGSETAKPVLKIGEPFTVGINLTVYQKSEVSIMLSEIGDHKTGEGYFTIMDGPTSKMNVYRSDVMEKNSSLIYKWTVKPTEKWAGGSIPIDLYYQIDEFGAWKNLVHGGFTIAYPYISNEYYEGETLTSEQPGPGDQLTLEQPASENSSASTASSPAFGLVTAILALALAFFRFSRK